MMSTIMMKVLIMIYIAIAVASGIERNWQRVLYWIGAVLIMLSVLWMSETKR